MAVGKRKERAVLYLSKVSRGDSSMKRWHDTGTDGVLIVDVIPLDDVLFKLEMGVCDLIKIDVEGMESEVLEGLQKQYILSSID